MGKDKHFDEDKFFAKRAPKLKHTKLETEDDINRFFTQMLDDLGETHKGAVYMKKMKKTQANGEEIAMQINKMVDGLPYILVVSNPVNHDVGVIGHSDPKWFVKDLEKAIDQFNKKYDEWEKRKLK